MSIQFPGFRLSNGSALRAGSRTLVESRVRSPKHDGAVVHVAIAVLAVGLIGCREEPQGSSQSASTASGARVTPAPSGAPSTAPKGRGAPPVPVEALYTGPTGTVRGWISVKGDPAPLAPELTKDIPAECGRARETYARIFREGMMHSLADALVAVTGYKGRLEAKSDSVVVEARGCAWATRTVAMTLGQAIKVVSRDATAYVPKLVGAETGAELVVIPGGDPVPLKAPKPGRYDLGDSMHLFLHADVFVLQYPTHAVTGLDGRYEITGIPPGEVEVSALLPATMSTSTKKVVVEVGKAVEVDLELPFDLKAYEAALAAQTKPNPAPTPTSSSQPAGRAPTR